MKIGIVCQLRRCCRICRVYVAIHAIRMAQFVYSQIWVGITCQTRHRYYKVFINTFMLCMAHIGEDSRLKDGTRCFNGWQNSLIVSGQSVLYRSIPSEPLFFLNSNDNCFLSRHSNKSCLLYQKLCFSHKFPL